jgi:chitin deacetylase
VQFVINYEEGGENSVLHGDPASEAFLSEIVGARPWPGQRNMNMESIYEYGSRAGFWRLWRLFTARRIPVTVYAIAHAMQRHPEAVAAMREAGWEIATRPRHETRLRRADERAHILEAIRIHTRSPRASARFYQPLDPHHAHVMEEGGVFTSDLMPTICPTDRGSARAAPDRALYA